MNKDYIIKIQDRIIKLLKSYNDKPLSALSLDCCSEISRLVGSWIKDDYNTAEIYILKGDNIVDNKSHDILAISYNKKIHLIDPTIWQFFPEDNNIFLGAYNDLDKAILIVAKKYRGNWQIKEKLSNFNKKQIDEWKKIIKENLE
jgi:hypothetical protein